MAVAIYPRLAYRLLGGLAQRSGESSGRLRSTLQKAHIDVRPEVYLSMAYLNAVFAVVVGLVLDAFLARMATSGRPLPFVVALALPAALGFLTYLVTFFAPDIVANGRGRDIDAKLPYALNYVATLAGAGLPPERIFASLAAQPIYGAMAEEAAWITRDLRILGKDVVTAFNLAIDRSPSSRLQDLLQGAITSVTSGGQLKDYFLAKAEQFLTDNRQDQKKFLDSLGILAESYVTVVVAAPVFLLVLMTVMLVFGTGGTASLDVWYLLILVVIPLAQLGFAATIKFVTPEA